MFYKKKRDILSKMCILLQHVYRIKPLKIMENQFIGKTELARSMGISLDTLKRRAKQLGIRFGNEKLLSPAKANTVKKKLLSAK
jgi:hypothetical protein